MGVVTSRTLKDVTIFKKQYRVIMLGLDDAGKTSILYKLTLGKTVRTPAPTIGFNVETIPFRNLRLQLWDIAGEENLRARWRFYLSGDLRGIIFVVDSVDFERLDECRDELHRVMNREEMRDVFVLVWSNKQDVPGALTTAEVQRRLKMDLLRERCWFVQPCSALTGDGLREGLAWLAANLNV